MNKEEDELKKLNDIRKEKNDINKIYKKAFLNSKLSTAIDQCFKISKIDFLF